MVAAVTLSVSGLQEPLDSLVIDKITKNLWQDGTLRLILKFPAKPQNGYCPGRAVT